MPATRPRASFEPVSPHFDVKSLVESQNNFQYVDRISVNMIDQQGLANFEKLVLLHVIIGGKPLIIDGFEERLDPWTFTPRWLCDNCGEDVVVARDLTAQTDIPLTMKHYLQGMGPLTNQFFDTSGAYKEKQRQRVYLKDIDCPQVWQDKLKEHIPSNLYYWNESTGDQGGPGAVPENNIPGRRLGKGIAKAGDLMSSLPLEMRAENLMCYIGHEGTYTPAHREMCASLGQNIMVEASGTVNDDGKPEKPGSSIWFMTESKDRQLVSEYWLSVLGHDIEVEKHFAQAVAWKKAPFTVFVVEQRPGDMILIPPLAPHQVWNRGTRTMKVAWNRTTVETLEMAINEALPRSRIVCRDEQYKNKAIIYFTLQKYSRQLHLVQQQASVISPEAAHRHLYTGRIKQLQKDFKRLFSLYKQILLSEMFNPDERDNPKGIEYLPFDGNVTCAYCRGNVFNRFLTCQSCKHLLGHNADSDEGDLYDVCMECYTMGRSCGCISNLKWVEQFRWKELALQYENWRKLIISLNGGRITEKTPLPLHEEHKSYGRRTLAEVCKDQLKKRPWKDVSKPAEEPKVDEEEDEEIIVGDDGQIKRIAKKKSKTWLKNNSPCHVCCKRHPNWRMANCKSCERWWCYGSLFRGWDKMPLEIMENPEWKCPHCLGICFAGNCRREGKMAPYEPKGTLLGHDTRKVADARSIEVLVDFSVSNLSWLKDDQDASVRAESTRIKRARAEAQQAMTKNQNQPSDDEDEGERVDESRVEMEFSPDNAQIDPALQDSDYGATCAKRLQQAISPLLPSTNVPTLDDVATGSAPEGYVPASTGGYVPHIAQMPSGIQSESENYPHRTPTDSDKDDVSMAKSPKAKKARLSLAGFRSSDLAKFDLTVSKGKTEAQRQFEKEKDRKALQKAKVEGRFIMLQAALKGKKRIVKMRLPSSSLQHVMLQAANDAKGLVQQAETRNLRDKPVGQVVDSVPASLLKSDIAQKNPIVPTLQRIKSTTKKARIPIERDTSYGYRPKEAQNDTQAVKRKKSTFDYEEVDIGSDDDDGESFPSKTVPRERRVRHHPGDGVSYPEALPNHYRDGQASTINPSKPPPVVPTSTPKRSIYRPAGKRPTMRPATTTSITDATNDSEDDAFMDIDQLAQNSFAAISKPNLASSPSSTDTTGANESASLGKRDTAEQEAINEDNRLAKLQALDMVRGEVSAEDMSEYEDDDIDSVPARAPVRPR
ncbi:hypothetical protein K431DRAFT_287873 [Polychaeton citri CBS 116435]|uniref:JmjC domain-containing protein n=1 Tax=Polychaeton citri CBS 116435 TaxID=1314669 RepID=A0A9P4Q2D2_9PEZI|nr:hypothetical protein K431DRAFT_287873 [Polychaeton citri CBS 116435]